VSEPVDAASPRTFRRWRAIAMLWGFAEATLFFVIPDVWITRVALRSRRESLVAVAFAIAGAMAGGAIVYLWGARDPAAVRAAFDALPAISPGLIDSIGARWQQLGVWAPLVGAFSGVPYKLYAAQAAGFVGLPLFVALSVLARGARFVVFALLAHLIARWATPRIGARAVLATWLGLWISGYTLYWLRMPN
jgi:membrane protein YqaA with SNARE-associated domain